MGMSKEEVVYLDYRRGGRLRTSAFHAMHSVYAWEPGDPSEGHSEGLAARHMLDEARERLAQCINAQTSEIIFTSGAEESRHLAIAGRRLALEGMGTAPADMPIVASPIEVATVLSMQGVEHYLDVDTGCRIIPVSTIPPAVTSPIVTVSLAQQETGTIQPVLDLRGSLALALSGVVHVDGCQALNNILIDVDEVGAELMTFSSHEVGGPEGVGALYVKSGTTIAPVWPGGWQQFGLRPGRENVPGIVGFSFAVQEAVAKMADEYVRVYALRDRLQSEIELISDVLINSSSPGLPNVLSVCFIGADAQPLITAMSDRLILASQTAPHVLLAMGRSVADSDCGITFSLGYETNDEEIDHAIAEIPAAVAEVRT